MGQLCSSSPEGWKAGAGQAKGAEADSVGEWPGPCLILLGPAGCMEGDMQADGAPGFARGQSEHRATTER